MSIVEHLVKELSGNQPQAAVDALAEIGEQAIPQLIEAFDTDDVDVRDYIGSALQKIGEASFMPLVKALKDKSAFRRCGAAFAVGLLGDSRGVEPLIPLLADEEEDVGYWAANGLKAIGAASVDKLIEAALNNNPYAHYHAILALVWIGDPRAFPVLMEAMQTGRGEIREIVARHLGDFGISEAIPALLSAFENEDSSIRAGVLFSLSKFQTPEIEALLIRASKDNDWQIRRNALLGLARFRTDRSTEILNHAINDPVEQVRKVARITLNHRESFQNGE